MPHPVRTLATALAIVALPFTMAHAQQAERFELPGSTIKLYNLIGTLDVGAATGGAASVEITRKGKDAAKLTVNHNGGTLIVVYPGDEFAYSAAEGNGETSLRVRDDGTFFGDNWHDGRGRKVRISSRGSGLSAWADVRLLLPAGVRAEVNLGVGRVTVANVNGNIEVNTASGDVGATATRGSLSIDTGSGDVTMAGHDGNELSVDTGSGDITLSAVKSDDVSLDTGSGDVRLDGLSGNRLSVDTGSGDIIVTSADVRGVSLETGSGAIRIALTTNIDDVSVETGSGDVVVSAPKSLGAVVEIETSSGDINTEFPIRVTKKSRDGLSGTIGDGKGQLSIDTGSGDVTLKQLP